MLGFIHQPYATRSLIGDCAYGDRANVGLGLDIDCARFWELAILGTQGPCVIPTRTPQDPSLLLTYLSINYVSGNRLSYGEMVGPKGTPASW